MKIALEEAFAIAGVEELTPISKTMREFKDNRKKLDDICGQRIKAMDEGEIDISVLSTTVPGIQGLVDAGPAVDLARQWNDYLAEAIAPQSRRLRGFAALPTRDPEAACAELVRAVEELGFVGALLNGYDNSGDGQALYYDAPQYLDLWRTAAELDVPIYLHPRVAEADRAARYADYPQLRGAAWGFHVETGEHLLRIILGGVFDKVPNAKMIIGHMGEIVVYWAWRIDHRIKREGWAEWERENGKTRKLSVTEYLRQNFFITTSGVFDTAGLMHALDVMGPERVLYSVDYPYESTVQARDWFNSLDLPADQLEMIAAGNARRVLKL